MPSLPLIDRPSGAALFLRPGGPVALDEFLADAHGLASRLPPQPPGEAYLLNLCRDRYWFAVAIAAALLRGRVAMLSGDPSPGMIEALVARFPGVVAVSDEEGPTLPCPAVPARGVGPSDKAPHPEIPADQLAAIVFTSGSTGDPVAHPKRWGELVQRSRAAGERFALREAAPATIVGTVPPGHMYGFETTILLPLHAACASWCGQAFFPADVGAALAAAAAPRILVTTPLQLRALEAIEASGVECCISATAPLDPALAAAIEARWQTRVLEIFGATECGSIASRRTTDGNLWRPYPGVSLRDSAGIAAVHAEAAPPVELADEIELLPDGRFRLLGRRADMVKLGGRRASLAGLNRILTGLEGVSDGMFVVPDDLDRRSTARLLALVVAPDRTVPSLLAELRGRIDPVFLPRRLVRVDALPRNALGKLPRQAVLDLLATAR